MNRTDYDGYGDPLYDIPPDYERLSQTEPSGSFAKGLRNGIAISLLIWAFLFGLAWLVWHWVP